MRAEGIPDNWIETNLSDVVVYGKGKKPKQLSPNPDTLDENSHRLKN